MVDCAQERVARFDPRTGLTRLITQRVSQASMTQRAGRAGRLEPGICLHLIAKEQAERAAAQSEPEILQSDLSGFADGITAMGMQRSGADELAGSTASSEFTGRETPVTDAGGTGR
ncbi:ATP-dependent helicase HrpB [Escherichia coli]|uniref:ATP-dependent helicase HrpB n=1 Tax=Escherichia coli TaxID=562 RepID=A0A3S4LXQ8_ECOLX|nr:ATP-dependent helicase HrpB [Escherichia coli]